MKKIFWLVVSFLALAQAPSFAEDNIVIKSVVGNPQIQRGFEKLNAQPGMKLQVGDVVQTNATNSQLDLSVNGVAGCRVLPVSEFVVIDTTRTAMKVEIKKGNAIMNLKKLPMGCSFQVETPSAIATVRGTQFWGRVQPVTTPTDLMTTFAVREGKVEVRGKKSGKAVLLKKGQAVDIAQDGSALPLIRPALEEEMKAMEQASQIKIAA